MGKKYRIYALLAGANVEAILYMLAAWQGSEWLNENFGGVANWTPICYLLALILIARSWYVIFRIMIKNQKEESQQASEKNVDEN